MNKPSPKRHWFQFSLQRMMLEVLLVGLLLGVYRLAVVVDDAGIALLFVGALCAILGAAIGNLFGRSIFGSAVGFVVSPIVFLALRSVATDL